MNNTVKNDFLPERHYVPFGSLLSQFRLSSVCLSFCNVGALHPTQGLKLSAIFLHRYTLAIL